MPAIVEITSFLGWCAEINISFLLIATLTLTLTRDPITSIHARLFGLSIEDVSRAYFQYLAQYKIATLGTASISKPVFSPRSNSPPHRHP